MEIQREKRKKNMENRISPQELKNNTHSITPTHLQNKLLSRSKKHVLLKYAYAASGNAYAYTIMVKREAFNIVSCFISIWL